ncbi:hypothetical protein [Roseibium sp. RKSG952]|uniref:hypothetical protein n=1 Tax=Roseibium sp. RKSG952 TaxID=2529384 RepID=UPI0012BC0FF7|nr:hypothetical protein [Roseibium sp. RKSG952]MTH94574.1 hypothetical protein [Roseibium sp. RKSG952]
MEEFTCSDLARKGANQDIAQPQDNRKARLEAALDTTARLVLRFGEPYLPFFLKIEAELTALDTKQDALARARKRVELF